MIKEETVPELTNGEFDEFIKKGVVLIDFFAEWCMPCLMMSPIIEDIAEKMKSKIKVGKVNVDDGQDIARKFGVSSIPNLIIFKNGKVIENLVGGISSDDLEDKLKKHI